MTWTPSSPLPLRLGNKLILITTSMQPGAKATDAGENDDMLPDAEPEDAGEDGDEDDDLKAALALSVQPGAKAEEPAQQQPEPRLEV